MSEMKTIKNNGAVLENEDEFALSPEAKAFLAQSLTSEADESDPLSLNRINRRFLGMNVTGRDFRDGKTQVKVRLRWMLLPAIVGMCVSVELTQMAFQGAFSQGGTNIKYYRAQPMRPQPEIASAPAMPKPFPKPTQKALPTVPVLSTRTETQKGNLNR